MFARKFTALIFLVLTQPAIAGPDLMVACYAPIPRTATEQSVCSTEKNRRVLHAHQGENNGRRRLMECGEFCAGWDDRTFCTEYMCDADTTGEICDTKPATEDRKEIVGLVDKAKAHFVQHAKELGSSECEGIMENLVCVCLDQNMME